MVMVSAKIRDEDRDFLKTHEIGVTELLRTAIYQRKNEIEGVGSNFSEEKRKREFFQNKFGRVCKFLEERGLLDEWIMIDELFEKQKKVCAEKGLNVY
jgi:hypothetical protein